jgi:hypothetical protein
VPIELSPVAPVPAMKIIVAATRHAHALSRRQVEALFAALPTEFGRDIDEFLLSNFERGAEPFEYVSSARRVEFYMPVVEKTPETTERALQEFVLGLARVQAGSTFWRPLSRAERGDYNEFLDQWLPVCRAALGR